MAFCVWVNHVSKVNLSQHCPRLIVHLILSVEMCAVGGVLGKASCLSHRMLEPLGQASTENSRRQQVKTWMRHGLISQSKMWHGWVLEGLRDVETKPR